MIRKIKVERIQMQDKLLDKQRQVDISKRSENEIKKSLLLRIHQDEKKEVILKVI